MEQISQEFADPFDPISKHSLDYSGSIKHK
jgi:hypothetical protein